MLDVSNLTVRYNDRVALNGAAMSAARGELVGLIGPNGAGKTSLIRAVARLIAFEGRISVEGKATAEMARMTLARHIAYLPQGHVSHWPMRVRDVVALGRLPHRSAVQKFSEADLATVIEVMERVDVAQFAERNIQTLSEGERARVMLARALAVDAPLLLADEPTASLDPYHQLRIMELLHRYAAHGAAVVAVLHDLSLAARFCDRLVLLHEGETVAAGVPEAVLSNENLSRTYHIAAIRGETDGQKFIMPYARLDSSAR